VLDLYTEPDHRRALAWQRWLGAQTPTVLVALDARGEGRELPDLLARALAALEDWWGPVVVGEGWPPGWEQLDTGDGAWVRGPPEWARAASAAQRAAATRGLHPTGRPPGPAGSRCGACRHLYRGRRWAKCQLDRRTWSWSRRTDVRLQWRGCARWEAP
jgi:hypothetical protein